MKENPLKGTRMYLAAPIEKEKKGKNYRTEPKKILEERFGIKIFDPSDDEKQQWKEVLDKAREEQDYETMTRISHSFLRKDLCLVDRSDFVIAMLPRSIPTVGCVHEVINSNNAKKPTLLICPEGKEHISFWYYGFIDHECMFGSWDDLYDYLQEVDDRKHTDNTRWAFTYGII